MAAILFHYQYAHYFIYTKHLTSFVDKTMNARTNDLIYCSGGATSFRVFQHVPISKLGIALALQLNILGLIPFVCSFSYFFFFQFVSAP